MITPPLYPFRYALGDPHGEALRRSRAGRRRHPRGRAHEHPRVGLGRSGPPLRRALRPSRASRRLRRGPVHPRRGRERAAYAKEGHASAQDWLGTLSGTSAGAAKGRLAAAERAAVDPTLTEALHEGGLSSAQLAVVTNAATEAPESTEDLLELVDQGASHQELSDAAARQEGRGAQPRDRAPAPGPGPRQPPPALAPGRFGGRAGRVLLRRGGLGPRGAPVEARAKELWKAAGAAPSPSRPTGSTPSSSSSAARTVACVAGDPGAPIARCSATRAGWRLRWHVRSVQRVPVPGHRRHRRRRLAPGHDRRRRAL